MKKTLAILLSCVVVVAAFFAVTMLTSAAEEAKATNVQVYLPGATTPSFVLNSSTPSKDIGDGTMVFDKDAGTLTLTNVSGVQAIHPRDGEITIIVKGENTIESNGDVRPLHCWNGSVAIQGDGTLNLKAASYPLTVTGYNLTVGGDVKLSVISTAGNAFICESDNGVVTFKDNAKVSITSAGAGVYMKGITPKFVVTDNAVYKADVSTDAIHILNNKTGTAPSATVEISGKAKVDVKSKSVAMMVYSSNIANFVPSVTIKGNASFISKTSGQGIVCKASSTGADKAVLQILDNANVDIDVTENSGSSGQGIDVLAGTSGSDVDITTKGTVSVNTTSSGGEGGALVLRGNGGHNVLIKDAVLNLTNTNKEVDTVCTAFDICTKSDIEISGTAIVNVNVIHNSTNKQCRPFGIRVHSNAASTMVAVKGGADLNIDLSGTAAAAWNTGTAGMDLTGALFTVSEDASVNVKTTSPVTPACIFGGTTFTVSDEAYVSLESTTNYAMLSNNNNKVTVTGNAVISGKGTAGSNLKASKNDTITAYVSVDLGSANPFLLTSTEASTYFKQAQVTLKDDLTLKFFVKYDGENPRMRFTLHDKAEIVEGVKEGDNWTFKFEGIAPQCIGDSILAELLPAAGNDTVIATRGYSILRYLNTVKTNSATSAQQKTLINDLMVYGGAAQTYTGHAGANIANGVVGSEFTELDASKKVTAVNNVDKTNFAFTAATVFFDGKNSLAFKFVNNSGKAVTFEVSGADGGTVAKEGNIYITDGILASQFGKTVTVTAKIDGDVVGTVSYSVNSYVYAMQNKGGNIQELVRATYSYGVSAAACAQ